MLFRAFRIAERFMESSCLSDALGTPTVITPSYTVGRRQAAAFSIPITAGHRFIAFISSSLSCMQFSWNAILSTSPIL